MREKISKGNHKKAADCKEGEKLYQQEVKVVETIRPRLNKILKTVL
jgi:hypothetical protein